MWSNDFDGSHQTWCILFLCKNHLVVDILVSCPGSYTALIGFTGHLSAIGSILTLSTIGIDYIGLDHVMVFANGGLLPSFGRIIKRAARLETWKGSYGVAVGVVFAATCLTFTKLVCLHTPYCNSSLEADRWVDNVAAYAYV